MDSAVTVPFVTRTVIRLEGAPSVGGVAVISVAPSGTLRKAMTPLAFVVVVDLAAVPSNENPCVTGSEGVKVTVTPGAPWMRQSKT
jgi:hypothetical protein